MSRARDIADSKPSLVSDQSNTSTGYLDVPSGTTAQRPGTPTSGNLRYNSEEEQLEFYSGTAWISTIEPTPTIASISGTIYAGVSGRSLTITGSNFNTDNISIEWFDGTTRIVKEDSIIPTSTTSVTRTIPASVYGKASGTTIGIRVLNAGLVPSNTDTSKSVLAVPSGGTETTSGNYYIHSFTTSGTFTNTISNLSVEYLIVAGGGGGGGSYYSGGGGAGGLLSGSTTLTQTSSNPYTISVGAGGGGGTVTVGGQNGDNSSAFGQTANGGGGGGDGGNVTTNSSRNGRSGGSGGGGGGNQTANGYVGGTGTQGQGNDGGNTAAFWSAGGGGGSNAAGGNGRTDGITNGGSGIQSSISGTATYYAAGGSGMQHGAGPTSYTTRASNIGGASPRNTNMTQTLSSHDALGYGSGGGGADERQSGYTRAGDGSDGIVIIRYQLPA